MNHINEVFKEIDYHLMNDSKPSEYLSKLLHENKFDEYPLSMLKELEKTEQEPKHHPEGNVWNHTMLVVDNAAQTKSKSSDKRVFMWAALLHDLGKPVATKIRKGRITAYDHDKIGEKLAEDFFKCFNQPEDFINKVVKLVRWHMQTFFIAKDMSFAEPEKMKSETSTSEIALLSLCDRLGRKPISKEKEKEERESVNTFLKKMEKI